MKKLIIISLALAVVLGLSVFELWYDTKTYLAVKNELLTFKQLCEENQEDLVVSEVLEAYEVANKTWHDRDEILMFSTNHNVVRNINEKFAYLEDFLHANVYPDVLSTVNGLIDTMEYMREEKYPLWGNIF